MRPDASNVEERLTAGGRELAVLTASAMQAARPPPPDPLSHRLDAARIDAQDVVTSARTLRAVT